jgi:hypothetical protein
LEKDYWVTEAIRALHSEFAGHFVWIEPMLCDPLKINPAIGNFSELL